MKVGKWNYKKHEYAPYELPDGAKATPFAMGCVADLALRELDKFDRGDQ